MAFRDCLEILRVLVCRLSRGLLKEWMEQPTGGLFVQAVSLLLLSDAAWIVSIRPVTGIWFGESLTGEVLW
jgi:hypothetical protein